MDKEQEQLQCQSFISIFKESLKIVLSCPKIFTKIYLAFILLPLSFIALLNKISKLLNNSSTLNSQQLPPPISSKLILFWVFEIFIGFTFSLFSISTVIYTIVCIYTGKEVTFKKIRSFIPKVWKRLAITLMSNFCISTASIFAVSFVLSLCHTIFMVNSKLEVGIAIFSIVLVILVFPGVIYTAIFWQLSNVISVMEEYRGFKAMKKSSQLIKGKLGIAIVIYLVLSICDVAIVILQEQIGQGPSIFYELFRIGFFGLNEHIYVPDDNRTPDFTFGVKELLPLEQTLVLIFNIVLNPLISLYSWIVYAVFYCVCKSYHHENIKKPALADHLE